MIPDSSIEFTVTRFEHTVDAELIKTDKIPYTDPAVLFAEINGHENKLSIWEIAWRLLKASPNIIKLIIYILRLKDGVMTQSTLDTVSGIIKAIVMIVGVIFGLNVPPEMVTTIVSIFVGIMAIWEFIKGILSNNPKFIQKPTTPLLPNNG
jgi:hypothetical protein